VNSGLRRHVADACLDRCGQTRACHPHRLPGTQRGTVRLRHKEAHLEIGRGQQHHHRTAGGHVFTFPVQGVEDERIRRRHRGLLPDRPLGTGERRVGRRHVGLGGGDGIGATAQARRFQLGGQFVDRSPVALMGQTDPVKVAGRGHRLGEEGFRAPEIEAGQFRGRAGLGQPCLERRQFGGPLAAAKIREAGTSLVEPAFRFAPGGFLRGVFEHIEGRARGHPGALGHHELL
jgi:hypothetical protein